MEASSYTTLARQSGLMREMQAVAHNIANISTTGFRREGVIFAEYVHPTGPGHASLSMAHAHARHTHLTQGGLERTGGAFDLAIEGPGFFQVQTPQGERLTRAGSFTPNEAGELATATGHLLLDAGGAPVFIPPDARDIAISRDGTVSANGAPLAQIGLVLPAEPVTLRRESGTLFATEGALEPVETPAMIQGFLENSNVEPVAEIARMIEVQRAYELGQSFLEREDDRIRNLMRTLGT